MARSDTMLLATSPKRNDDITISIKYEHETIRLKIRIKALALLSWNIRKPDKPSNPTCTHMPSVNSPANAHMHSV